MNLFYLLFDNVDTVFSPIEAPGAKEMVWGASIFRPEAPNFQINMVKKDSKNSCVFQPQNTHVQHQYNKKILGKKPFKGLWTNIPAGIFDADKGLESGLSLL